MSIDREVRVVGVRRQLDHPAGCACECCGPALALFLSEYEAVRLLDALERRDGADTGDWHGQLRMKLTDAVGRRHLDEANRRFGVTKPAPRVGWEDVGPGDVVSLMVFDHQLGNVRERRTVVRVDWPIVTLAEGGRTYDFDATEDVSTREFRDLRLEARAAAA